MNLKNFITALFMLLLCITPAFASYIDNFSNDTEIQGALAVLQRAGAEDVFNNLQENSVKIAFYDLSHISYDYMNHFAINTVDSFGNRYILINTKFKNASPEELACLIAHESCHKLAVATLEEETFATRTEAKYWDILKDKNKTYEASALLDRLNGLSALEKASTDDIDLIQDKILNHAFYIQQLAIVR